MGWLDRGQYGNSIFVTVVLDDRLTGYGVPEGKLRYRREISRLAPYNSKRGRSNFTRSTWKCFYCLGPNDRDSCMFGHDGTTCDSSLLPACEFLKKHDQFLTKRPAL